MQVTQILNQKGSSEVATISPDASVADAVKILSEKKIGALVASHGDGNVAGILSERDVVRHLGREGAAVLSMKVNRLMTDNVECCAPTDRTNNLLDRMTRGRFRHMPVLEDGRMIGLLSIGDVVKARMDEIESENQAMAGMLSG